MSARRIGLIQTRGIGDLIIALPIADHYLEQGCEVVWPIDEKFFPIFQPLKPDIVFLPIPQGEGYFYERPLELLEQVNCDTIFSLYSYLGGPGGAHHCFDRALFNCLKFDEYKYAISQVPFAKKWTLNYPRDLAREQALYDRLDIRGPYVCLHTEGSNFKLNLDLPGDIAAGHQIIHVAEITDNPFDWLLTFERASKLVLLDSCFANLVEGVNLPNEKYLLLRSQVQFTPVFRNGWRFVKVDAH